MTHLKTGWTPSCFKKPRRSASVLLVIFMAAGCNRSPETVTPEEVPAVTSTNAESSAETNAEPDTKISDERATKFAKNLGQAIVSGNSKAVAQLIAWPEIVARAVEPFDIDEQDKGDLIRDAVSTAPSITREIAIAVRQGSVYQLVHVKQRGDEPFALFRLLEGNGTLNYHLFRVRKIRGRIRADQFFSAAKGGEMADAFRNMLVEGAKNFMTAGQISEEQKRLIEDLETQQQLTDAVSFGFDEEALKLYDQLPNGLKRSRVPMLDRIKATPDEDQAAYLTAVNEHLTQFPNDPAGALIALDAGATRKDIDLLLHGHHSLKEWTGGDQYLDLLVGASLAECGQNDLALKITQSVDPSTIGVSGAHTFKLVIGLAADDHAEVLNQLRILRDEYRINVNELDKTAKFLRFVESPEYEQWKNDGVTD